MTRLESLAAELAAEIKNAKRELELALAMLINIENQATEEAWFNTYEEETVWLRP